MARYVLPLLFVPIFAFAGTQAGFPSQSIWVSSASASEGETLVVSSVVVNDTEAILRGTLVFIANDIRIGAREFELPSEKSQIHSIEWKPKKGEYKLSARIEGTSAALSQKETPAVSVVVKDPPAPPSEVQKTITQVVQTGSSIASSSAPILMQTAQNIFEQTEKLRNAGIERLENYLAANAVRAPAGTVSGTSTHSIDSKRSRPAGSRNSLQASNAAGFASSTKNGGSVLSNFTHTAAAGALFAFKNVAFFYPILAFLILGTLYLFARRIKRRPSD